MFNLRTPFFNPLYRRVLTVALALGWAVVEALGGSVGFAMIFAAMGIYAAWQLLFAWAPQPETEDETDG